MNLEKLKDSARKFEQKEDWRKAIEVYLKAIQQIESGAETSPDLSLYNRIGDLYLKINDIAAAVRSYERAVDLYADQGFFNNAIALCGKILRVNPGRTQTYLKLAQLHARKNVVIEAKRNLIEFLERMNALGQLDQAFQSVKDFADQFSGSQEIRMMLVELLRAASREEEALEQLAKIAGDLESRGGPPRPDAGSGEADGSAPAAPAPRPAARAPGRGDLIFLDTGFDVPVTAAGRRAERQPAPHRRPICLWSSRRPPPEVPRAEPGWTRSPPMSRAWAWWGRRPSRSAGWSKSWKPTSIRMRSAPCRGSRWMSLRTDAQFEDLPLEQIDQPAAEASDAEPVDGLIDVADDLDLTLVGHGRRFPSTAEPDADLDLDIVDEEPPAPTAGLPLIEAEPISGPTADEVAGARGPHRRRPGEPRRCTASWRTGCCSRGI